MSRVKTYHTKDGVKRFKRELNLDDLLDLKAFPSKRITSFRALFGGRDEKSAKIEARRILKVAGALIGNDLVEGRSLTFPKQNFGAMKISDMRKLGMLPRNERLMDSTFVGGCCFIDGMVQKINGNKLYMFKLISPFIKRIREKKAQGFRYA